MVVLKPKLPVLPVDPAIAAVAAELVQLQRQRAVVIKSRNMQANRLRAIVAGTLGYSSGMEDERERRAKFKEADAIIKGVCAGTAEHPLSGVITTTMIGVDSFNALQAALEKEMRKLAKRLPVAAWVEKPEQRGFGLLFLAIVVGETGDLANYANPAKVWRRLGCAPWTFEDKTLMGATWRGGREGKLPAEQWEQYGYSPRRRSIAYLIGEGLLKQNFIAGGTVSEIEGSAADYDDLDEGAGETETIIGDIGKRRGETTFETEESGAPGPYRARYLQAKAHAAATHPHWTRCPKCGGKAGKCGNCKGTGKVMKRCHLHGMLLATKLLLKNLWVEWNGHPPKLGL